MTEKQRRKLLKQAITGAGVLGFASLVPQTSSAEFKSLPAILSLLEPDFEFLEYEICVDEDNDQWTAEVAVSAPLSYCLDDVADVKLHIPNHDSYDLSSCFLPTVDGHSVASCPNESEVRIFASFDGGDYANRPTGLAPGVVATFEVIFPQGGVSQSIEVTVTGDCDNFESNVNC